MKKALIFAGGGSRGAFQIGVWKYLVERNWKPDIICGTSIGAINAAGIGSGLDISELIQIWTTHNRRKMYRINLLPFLYHCLPGSSLRPLFDTRSIQTLLSNKLDFNRIKKNDTKIVVSTVNVHTAKPHFFDNEQIGLKHILASSAMPVLFPWQQIDGQPHWDGGVMANVPLQPALDYGAQEIIIVMLSPISQTPQPFPRDLRTALEHVFEQFLTSSYQSVLNFCQYKGARLNQPQVKYAHKHFPSRTGNVKPNIITLAPKKMLGFRSLINFSLPQAKQLINEGYKTAHMQLKPFI